MKENHSNNPSQWKCMLWIMFAWENGKKMAIRFIWVALALLFSAFYLEFPISGASFGALTVSLVFSRRDRWLFLMLFLSPALYIGIWVASLSIIPMGFSFLVVLLISILVLLPLVIDKLLLQHCNLNPSIAIYTFAFIFAFVHCIYIRFSPLGVANIFGPEILIKTSISQVLSVGGICFFLFVLGWTVSLISFVILKFISPSEQNQATTNHVIKSLKPHLTLWLIFIALLLFGCGFTRMATPENSGNAWIKHRTVRIAGVQLGSDHSPEDEIWNATESAAIAGAKFIVWSEWNYFSDTYIGDPLNYSSCETGLCHLISKARKISMKYGIYVLPCFILTTYQDPHMAEKVNKTNKVAIVSPTGQIISLYSKSYPVFSVESDIQAAQEQVVIFDTEFGRISTVICNDLYFPNFIQKIGRKQIDLLLVPSQDWMPLYRHNTYEMTLRAVENGFTILRVTDNGRSIVIDSLGNILFEDNFFGHVINSSNIAKPYFFIIDVPSHSGRFTLYPWLYNIHEFLLYIFVVIFLVIAIVDKFNWHKFPQFFNLPKMQVTEEEPLIS